MIAVEVFRKQKKMKPVLQKCWPVIAEKIIYPPMGEEDPAQKLVFFGLMTYATVYQSAIVGTMSSSAAHYLARMQLDKCDLGQAVAKVVEETFSGLERDEEQEYADLYHNCVATMIEKIMVGDSDIEPSLQALADGYRPVPLVAKKA